MRTADESARPPDDAVTSWPGQPSRVFSGEVGRTYPAHSVDPGDYLIDRHRYSSEGDWAFCRFTSQQVPAIRMGFQIGSFDIGPGATAYDPSLLQLHLEVVTAEGAQLWIPTGQFPGEALVSSASAKDVRLMGHAGEILHIAGWPEMAWHVRSDDGELEVQLDVEVGSVTVLPDCILPHAVFAMWETLGRARGRVRVGSHWEDVEGHMFYDHTRVLRAEHDVAARRMYLYTTLALADGGGIFGYHAVDDHDRPLDYYCFGIHVDAAGRGTFLGQAELSELAFDADGLPCRWQLHWQSEELAVAASIEVQPIGLGRGWGGPAAPRSRATWPIFPLVLEATVVTTAAGKRHHQTGRGLAEYFDADKWFAP